MGRTEDPGKFGIKITYNRPTRKTQERLWFKTAADRAKQIQYIKENYTDVLSISIIMRD